MGAFSQAYMISHSEEGGWRPTKAALHRKSQGERQLSLFLRPHTGKPNKSGLHHASRSAFTKSAGSSLPMRNVQGSGNSMFLVLVNFVPVAAYHFSLKLPAAFTQPGDHLSAEPCTYSARASSILHPPLRRFVQPQKSPKCFILPLPYSPSPLLGTFLKVVSVRVSDSPYFCLSAL